MALLRQHAQHTSPTGVAAPLWGQTNRNVGIFTNIPTRCKISYSVTITQDKPRLEQVHSKSLLYIFFLEGFDRCPDEYNEVDDFFPHFLFPSKWGPLDSVGFTWYRHGNEMTQVLGHGVRMCGWYYRLINIQNESYFQNTSWIHFITSMVRPSNLCGYPVLSKVLPLYCIWIIYQN